MNDLQKATFAGGCFWCTEAIFQNLKGVAKIISGYSGGTTDKPTYEQITSGTTGHAESIQITYDPNIISYNQILDVFWKTHDPTTLNRQGPDTGTQYRSVIFYHNEEQKKEAERSKADLERSKADLERSNVLDRPVVTEIVPFEKFYPAEEYHQEYYRSNPNQPYCRIVIDPKINKLKKNFRQLLK